MQNVTQPYSPQHTTPAVPNGYNQTAGGYYYTVGLTQNPYMMQAQGINPTTGAYLNTNPASLPTAQPSYNSAMINLGQGSTAGNQGIVIS